MTAFLAWLLNLLVGSLPAKSSAPVMTIAGQTITAGGLRKAATLLSSMGFADLDKCVAGHFASYADDAVLAEDALAIVADVFPPLAGYVELADLCIAVAPTIAGLMAGFSPTRAGEEAAARIVAQEASRQGRR